METMTARLITELRDRGHTWYRIARLCDVDDQTVRNWRAGRTMSDDTARRACVALGKSDRETMAALATLAQERAGDAETKRLWGVALKRLGGAVAAVAALFIGMPPPPAAAMVRCDVGPVYYVKSRRRRPTAKRRARWTDAVRRHLRRISANSLTWAARRIAAAALLVPLAATAGEPWSATERALGVAAGTALALDWLQTRYIALHPGAFNEHNPILGEHPSPGAVNVYFAGAALGGYLAADVLPAHWRRAFLAGGLVVELAVIRHNARLGIGLAF